MTKPQQEDFNLLGICADVDYSAMQVADVLKCKTVTPPAFETGVGGAGLIGLPNVTNDLQVRQDFTGYTPKSPPVDNDWVLINDSEDSYKIKKVKIISLANAYTPDIDIAINFSAAEFIDLYANPVKVIDAPGTGKTIEIIWAAVHSYYNTLPWLCASTVAPQLGTLTPKDGIYCPQGCFNGATQDAAGLFYPYGWTFTPNLPIYFYVHSGVYSIGDGTITLHIKYRVRTI
jgi:hypothetical protein